MQTNSLIIMSQGIDNRKAERLLDLANTDSDFYSTILIQQYQKALFENNTNFDVFATSKSARESRLLQEYLLSHGLFNSAYSGSGQRGTIIDNSETTNQALLDANERDMDFFKEHEYKFYYTLRHVVFEDGCDNDATALFDSMITRNKYVAISWLQNFWCEHQGDSVIFEGIIRLIGRVSDKGFWKMLFSIVRSGFTDKDPKVQEAAIMVAESWRTKNCLDALKNTQYSTPWIQDYATQIIAELTEELGDEIY